MKSNLSFIYYPMLLLLLGISFSSTSYGVLSYMTNVDSLASIDFMNFKVMVSLAVVFVITLFAFLSLDNLLNSRYIKSKFFFLLLYLLFTTISIGFGYPFWWNNLIANNTLNNKVELTTDRGLNNIEKIKNNLELSKKYIEKISNIAKSKKEKEVTEGGSCDGIDSKSGSGPYSNSRTTITVKINSLVEKLNLTNSEINNLSKELTDLTNKTRHVTINSNNSTEIEKIINSYVKKYNGKVDIVNKNFTSKIDDIFRLIDRLKLATINTKENTPIIMKEVFGDKDFKYAKGFHKCSDRDIFNTLSSIEKNFNDIHNLNESKLNITIEDKVNRARKALNGLLTMMPFFNFEIDNKYDFSFISLLFTVLIDLGILALTIIINGRSKYEQTVRIVLKWCKNKKDKENVIKILNNLVVEEKYIIFPEEEGIDCIYFKYEDERILTYNDFKQLLNIISSINNAVNLSPIRKFPNDMDFTSIENVCEFEGNVTYVGYKINNSKVIEDIRRLLASC